MKRLVMKSFKDALHYISKEDPECIHLRKEKCWISGMLKCENDVEALKKYAKGPSDVCGILAGRSTVTKTDYRVKCKKREITLRSWQTKLLNLLKEVPNDRDILWIYDKEGGSGKNTFGDYLEDREPDLFFTTQDLGTSRDAATILANKLESGWNQSADEWSSILINLVRSSENHQRMYTYIEDMKDGRCTVQKYKGKSLRYDTPHVVVFANFLPIIKCVTISRWKVFRVDKKDNDWTFDPISAKDVLREQELKSQENEHFQGNVGPSFNDGGMSRY